jgi:transposase
MLGKPGPEGAAWAKEKFRGRDVVILDDGYIRIRMAAIRLYADQNGISIEPLEDQAPTVWA